MIGDKVHTQPHHTKAALEVYEAVKDKLEKGPVTFSVAGQSGAGKSEIAEELAKALETGGRKAIIFQQDDYFFYPPKTNHNKRLDDISWVGMKEVNLSLLDEHLAMFKQSDAQLLQKPLVIFGEDRITSEKVDLSPFDILIAEGTYTTALKNADYHVFIDRNYHDTEKHRKERGRDVVDKFSNDILKIEDKIITKHKSLASFIVRKDYSVEVVE